MRKLLGLWLVLLVSYVFAWAIIGRIGFQTWDLRYDVWIKIVLLPFIQSVAVAALVFGLRLPAAGSLLRNSIRLQPVIGLLLAIDAFILMAGWLVPNSPWTDLTASGSIPNNYTGLKGMAAALMVVQLTGKRAWKVGERVWLLLFAAGLAAFGLDYLIGWSARIPEKVLTDYPLLWRWIILYGPAFCAGIAVLLKMESMWRGVSERAGMLLNAAVTFALTEAMVVASNVFNRPYLERPWSTLARTLGFLMMTSIWFAVFDVRKSSSVK